MTKWLKKKYKKKESNLTNRYWTLLTFSKEIHRKYNKVQGSLTTHNTINRRNGHITMECLDILQGWMMKIMSNSLKRLWSILTLKTKTIMKIHNISNLSRGWTKRNSLRLLLKKDWCNFKNSKKSIVNLLMNCKLLTAPKIRTVSLKVTQIVIMVKTKMMIINPLINWQINKVKNNWKRDFMRKKEHSPKWQMWNLLVWECSIHGMQDWDCLNRRILLSQKNFYKDWKISRLWIVWKVVD